MPRISFLVLCSVNAKTTTEAFNNFNEANLRFEELAEEHGYDVWVQLVSVLKSNKF